MITQNELKEVLHYDSETGLFTWKVTLSNVAKKGKICNCLNVQGYIQIRINKKLYLGHRLAWLYMYGSFPSRTDHINGIRNDNRASNLREVTNSQNMYNTALRKDNTSGTKGVHWIASRGKYRVEIMFDKIKKHLGYFKDLELACLVANEAREKYHGEFVRGC